MVSRLPLRKVNVPMQPFIHSCFSRRASVSSSVTVKKSPDELLTELVKRSSDVTSQRSANELYDIPIYVSTGLKQAARKKTDRRIRDRIVSEK